MKKYIEEIAIRCMGVLAFLSLTILSTLHVLGILDFLELWGIKITNYSLEIFIVFLPGIGFCFFCLYIYLLIKEVLSFKESLILEKKPLTE